MCLFVVWQKYPNEGPKVWQEYLRPSESQSRKKGIKIMNHNAIDTISAFYSIPQRAAAKK